MLSSGPSWSVALRCRQADTEIIADGRERFQMSSWGGQILIGWRSHFSEEDDMKTFIGIDVSLASSAVCVLDERGRILKRAQLDSAPEAFIAFLRDLPWRIEAIGLEAGPLSQWLHRGLREAGFEMILMETRQVKAVLKAMPVKTDRRDAEGIARLLRIGVVQAGPLQVCFGPGHVKRFRRMNAPRLRAISANSTGSGMILPNSTATSRKMP